MFANRKEVGATFTSILVGLIVAGIFFTVAFKLFTPYKDHATIKSIVESVIYDDDLIKKSFRDMRLAMAYQFNINQVKLPSQDSLKMENVDGVLNFDLDYEVRVPMFYNVDAVVKFKDHYEVVKP